MLDAVARNSVQVNARYNVSASHAAACDNYGMDNAIFSRLVEVLKELKEEGTSLTQMSVDIGAGRNYVQQMIKDEKKPTTSKLTALLEQLPKERAAYVLTGFSFTAEDLEFLEMISGKPDEVKQAVKSILLNAKEREAS